MQLVIFLTDHIFFEIKSHFLQYLFGNIIQCLGAPPEQQRAPTTERGRRAANQCAT